MGKRHDYGVDTGRLNTALAEAAQQIVYARYRDDRPDEFGAELLAISEIDRAYLVMLAEEHIADVTAVRRMLRQIDELRGSRFAAVRDRPMPGGSTSPTSPTSARCWVTKWAASLTLDGQEMTSTPQC